MTTGLIYILLAVLFWSFDGVLIKSIPWDDGLAVNTGRAFFSFVVLSFVFQQLPSRFSSKILKGTAAHFVYTMFFVLACVWGPAANAVILAGTAPVFSALIGRFAYNTSPPSGFFAALVGIAAGVVLMNVQHLGTFDFAATFAGLMIGIGGGVWGVLCNRVLDEDDRQQSILWSSLVQAAPALLLAPQLGTEALPWSFKAIVCLALLGAFIGGASTCFAKAASMMDPSLALLLGNAQAPLLAFWVWYFLGEIPSTLEIAGGMLVFAASLWVGWKEYRRTQERT